MLFGGTGATDLETLMATQAADVSRCRHRSRRHRVIAFTSGTTGKPKGTMHFHRDLIAACDCWPLHTLRASPDDSSPAARRSRSRSGWAASCCFRCRIGAATLLVERPAPDAVASRSPRSIARRCCSPRRRPIARWRPPRPARPVVAAQVRVGGRSAARRDAKARGRTRPASRSSTASARPRCSTSSSRTTRRTRDRARPAPSVPGYRACVMDDAGAPLPAGQVGQARGEGSDRVPVPRRRPAARATCATAGTTPATRT